METYRIEVGRKDGVKPGDIVGAIANEANISSKFIGHIKLHDDFSTVDLPSGMPKEVFETLSKTWVCQKQLRITRAEGNAGGGRGRGGDDFKRKKRPANKDGAPRKPRAKKADS